jgi:hypothetical protein
MSQIIFLSILCFALYVLHYHYQKEVKIRIHESTLQQLHNNTSVKDDNEIDYLKNQIQSLKIELSETTKLITIQQQQIILLSQQSKLHTQLLINYSQKVETIQQNIVEEKAKHQKIIQDIILFYKLLSSSDLSILHIGRKQKEDERTDIYNLIDCLIEKFSTVPVIDILDFEGKIKPDIISRLRTEEFAEVRQMIKDIQSLFMDKLELFQPMNEELEIQKYKTNRLNYNFNKFLS